MICHVTAHYKVFTLLLGQVMHIYQSFMPDSHKPHLPQSGSQ